MGNIPQPIVDALIAGAAALIAALVGVAIAALNAWRKRLEQDIAVQAAGVAVLAAEQAGNVAKATTDAELSGAEKKAIATKLAPNATDAMIEAAVVGLAKGLKGAD